MRAHEFDCIARLKGSELFSLTLSQVDAFLGCASSHYTPVHDTKSRTHAEDHRRALYQMEKEIHLAATITQEDLAAYREHKNVDSATLLPKLYTAFLDVFSRKEANTLPKHEPYDHAIHLKEGTQALTSALYSLSRNEALKLCQYLDENLSKGLI